MADTSPGLRSIPRWVRILLILSLGVNLAVAGLAIGSAYKWHADGGPPRSVDLSLGPLSRALAPEDRRAVVEELRRNGDGQRPDFREIRRRSADLLVLLRAEDFDAAAFATGLDRIRDMALSFQDVGQAALVERIAAMSADERRALADRFEEQSRRGSRDADGPDRSDN